MFELFLPCNANVLVVDLPRVIPLPSARLNVPAPLLVKIPWTAFKSLTNKCPDEFLRAIVSPVAPVDCS